MTKIIALKDSPLAKQGEVFEYSGLSFHIGFFTFPKETIDKWISDGWFSVVEEKLTLAEKIKKVWDFEAIPTRKEGSVMFSAIARSHAIEIVREAANEWNLLSNCISLERHIIQKLDEKMR